MSKKKLRCSTSIPAVLSPVRPEWRVHQIGRLENKPKDEQVLRAEDEDLAREAAVVAAGQTEFTRERQLADNVFIRL